VKDEVIRAFIAVEIEAPVRAALGEMQTRLKEAGVKVSWVAPENMHLTLAFLGNIPIEGVSKLGILLDRVAQNHGPFILNVEGLGFFGSRKSPRVIWVGMNDSSGTLTSLQRDIVEAVSALGYVMEKRVFKPHLTLGRVRSSQKVDSLTLALRSAKNVRFGSAGIERLLLMRSQLAPHGVRYTILHESALKGAD